MSSWEASTSMLWLCYLSLLIGLLKQRTAWVGGEGTPWGRKTWLSFLTPLLLGVMTEQITYHFQLWFSLLWNTDNNPPPAQIALISMIMPMCVPQVLMPIWGSFARSMFISESHKANIDQWELDDLSILVNTLGSVGQWRQRLAEKMMKPDGLGPYPTSTLPAVWFGAKHCASDPHNTIGKVLLSSLSCFED